MFAVWKTSGSWRPVIDLYSEPFHPHDSVQDGDPSVGSAFCASGRLDGLLRSNGRALAGSVHPDSRKFLRFVAFSKPYQFRALCFVLSTALHVFTRVMAPVSTILHCLGIWICRYLNNWLIQAHSREKVRRSQETVLSLCRELGILVNPEKSNFVPSQQVLYLGTITNSVSFRASPSQQSHEASVNRRIILVLQASACVLLAGPPGDSLLPLPSRYERSCLHAIPSADSPPLLGPGGRLSSCPVGRSVPTGSLLVAQSCSPPGRCFAGPSLPRPRAPQILTP